MLKLILFQKIDELAYMRFASVYLDFDEAEDFKRFVAGSEKLQINQ